MTRYRGNETVPAGVYLDARRLRFRSLEEAGRLPDDGGLYRRVHGLVLLVLGPLIGLAYVVFLPLIGFIAMGVLIVDAARSVLARRRARRTERADKSERKRSVSRPHHKGRDKAA